MAKPMLIGYARVSTVDQHLALQRDALTEAGCQKIFTEQMSGAVTDRPALHDALEFARSGDTANRVEARPPSAVDEAVDRNPSKTSG
jgi:predicted site-specific integrase-resolvase